MSPLAVENGSLVTSGGSLCETCCSPPPETGACCYTEDGTNWICEDGITAEECAAKPNIGVNYYPGQACGDIDCPEPPPPPECDSGCQWIADIEEFEGNGRSAREYTLRIGLPPDPSWFVWNEGYPELLEGTNWRWIREYSWSENDYETYGKSHRRYRVFQCNGRDAVDITDAAVTSETSPTYNQPLLDFQHCYNEYTGYNGGGLDCYDDSAVDYPLWTLEEKFPPTLLDCPSSARNPLP